MGTDIHTIAETKNHLGIWMPGPLEPAGVWRNHLLYYILCGVRGGGLPAIPQISTAPRGLPDDATQASKEYLQLEGPWSWVSLAELESFNWDHMMPGGLSIMERCPTAATLIECLRPLGVEPRLLFAFN